MSVRAESRKRVGREQEAACRQFCLTHLFFLTRPFDHLSNPSAMLLPCFCPLWYFCHLVPFCSCLLVALQLIPYWKLLNTEEKVGPIPTTGGVGALLGGCYHSKCWSSPPICVIRLRGQASQGWRGKQIGIPDLAGAGIHYSVYCADPKFLEAVKQIQHLLVLSVWSLLTSRTSERKQQ